LVQQQACGRHLVHNKKQKEKQKQKNERRK
jgi:hypothetical protein